MEKLGMLYSLSYYNKEKLVDLSIYSPIGGSTDFLLDKMLKKQVAMNVL